MSFFILLIKSWYIEKKLQRYEEQKKVSLNDYMKGKHRRRRKPPKLNFIDKRFAENTLWKRIRTDGTFPNAVIKSLFGFFGGFLLTYVFFIFFVFQLNFTLWSATVMSAFVGCTLTLGLAFSKRVRCIVFLLLPQFFSKRGRQALAAYAFILALTGPAKNTLHNTGVLSESLACGQEQLKTAAKEIINLVKQPFYAIRDAIKSVVLVVKKIVEKIKNAFLALKRIIMSILGVIKSAFQWLGSVVNICNKKVGTPFQRCMNAFDDAIVDCKAKLGSTFGWLCSVAYVASALCYVVKFLDLICMLLDFISDSIIGSIKKKFRNFVNHIRNMFYVSIKFSHSFHFETNQSRSVSDVTAGIVTEIRHRTDRVLAVFDWMSCATSFFFLFILLKVLNYRRKYLTDERFDNKYITDDMKDIDFKRAEHDQETIFPLNNRERNKFVTLGSCRLLKSEKTKLARSLVFLLLMTFKLLAQMFADYSLYWLLANIRHYGRMQGAVEAPNMVGANVVGEGVIADLFRGIIKAFTPITAKFNLDPTPCLPDPVPPDFDRYAQIISLVVLCWILALFEPYGLRLRQIVMANYHPQRARLRAVWLYNHIIRTRGTFLTFTRRQLRTRFVKGSSGVDKVTFVEMLRAKLNNIPILRNMFGKSKEVNCLVCAKVERKGETFIRCSTPTCIGVFCESCFRELQNKCTICLDPIVYGDLSDISEVIDSSDDPKCREKKARRKKAHLEMRPSSSSSELDYSYQTRRKRTAAGADMEMMLRPSRSYDIERQRLLDDVSMQIYRIDSVTSESGDSYTTEDPNW